MQEAHTYHMKSTNRLIVQSTGFEKKIIRHAHTEKHITLT